MENPSSSTNGPDHRPPSRTSTAHSNVSTISQKTLIQARARRQIAELEQARLVNETRARRQIAELEQARLANEKELIEARMSEEMALLDISKDERMPDNVSVSEWVEQDIESNDALRQKQIRISPTKPPDRPDNDIAFLAHAITDAIQKTNNSGNDRLIGRLSAKDLPDFSGDAMDWLRFKNAFQTTTAIGRYTDQENVSRLQRCLKGDAWEAVAARLIAATSADAIMKTLEIRFGRSDLILHKLISDIKRLPKLTGTRSELLILANKVANCVAAIEATDSKEYLGSPELVSQVINKLTEPLIYRWVDFRTSSDRHQPRLAALAEYLMKEAERMCRAGVIEIPDKTTRHASAFTSKRPVLTVIENSDNPVNTVMKKRQKIALTKSKCLYCERSNHPLDKCFIFRDIEVNKRWDWVCKKKLCFRCLNLNHRRDRCRTKRICDTCKRGHHSLLHRDDWNKPVENRQMTSDSVPLETTANVWDTRNKKVFLKILPVVIEGPIRSLQTYALLDEGSTITLIESEIARSIGAEGPKLDLNLCGAVGDNVRAPSRSVSLIIKTPEEDYRLERVRTVDKLNLPMQSLNYSDLELFPHLKDIPLQAFKAKPTMIIGQDYWHLIVSREVREGRKNEPVASLTRLGWVLHGFSSSITKNLLEHSCHVRQECKDYLHELVKSYFKLESIGIKYEDGHRNSSDECHALDILNSKSSKVGDKWETGLLWRSDDAELPDNRQNAESRLKVVERNVDRDPSFAADYMKQVDNMLEKNYAEEVIGHITCRRVWYLPHFGVRNPNKPDKLRLVFDAKATTKGVSLNSELLSGPDLLNSLIGVLLRFRERAIAVTGDIREMFLQVKIIEEDQKSQCFLWRGMDRDTPPRTYKMTSMIFGATSSPCTATYILRRNADEFVSTYPRAVEAIKIRHYVDDYLDSVDTEEEMIRLINEVIMIHKNGGFEIRGWTSNKPHVLPHLPNSSTINLLQQTNSETRTLGLIWRPEQDQLAFDVNLRKVDKDVAQGLRRPTKREMLKIIMSVFDPLGFLCPTLIRAKILLQEIWRSGVRWDQQIGPKLAEIWFRWLQDMKRCKNVSISRCYGFSDLNNLQLHVFVDASTHAYSSVAYICRDGEVTFVVGKSRVAPLKPSTVPRLELQAALMGARLGDMIKKEQNVKFTRCFYWTDSQTVWRWIRNNPRKINVFVSNRLAEIDELTKADDWRWLPGLLNAADAATRAEGNLETNNLKWIHGPEFLYQSKENWPSLVPDVETEEELTENLTIATITQEKGFVDLTRFSNWRRLCRCIAALIVFTEKCRKIQSHLTPRHELRAKNLILQQVQAESFPDEIQNLRRRENLHMTSRLRQLNPRLDENGLLRVNSRIEAGANLTLYMKEPIILDGRHLVTKMIITHKHKLLGHHGMGTLINEIRQKYYVLRLRHTVRSIIANCVICKARRARCEQPLMAGLPPARLQHHCRPFTYCGIDLFGPMLVTIGRRTEKRWGVLFTCLSTRAVAIELAASLTSDSTILAIRRMVARRGFPRQMYSDNGTNFRAAGKELRDAAKKILNEELLTQETQALGIEWRFNPPDAPHMGGVWERLVRSIKTALYATLHSRAPREEVLTTLIAEAENIVNSRPLTHVTLDPDEEEALTPNHFLLGASNPLPRPGQFLDQDLHLRKQWRITQRLADHFWSRWIKEYLPTLHERKKWTKDSGYKISVGDVVLIADSSAPRNVWSRGKVIMTTPGRDGRVRIVDVATKGGVLRRPASKIVVLLRAVDEPSAATTDATSQRGGECC